MIDSTARPERVPFWWRPGVAVEGLADGRPATDPTMRPGDQPWNGGITPGGERTASAPADDSHTRRVEQEVHDLRSRVANLEAVVAAQVADRSAGVAA